MRRSVAASQSLTVCRPSPTRPAYRPARRRPSPTEPEWPSSVCSGAPVTASQSLTVLSREPDATSLLSGEKATE